LLLRNALGHVDEGELLFFLIRDGPELFGFYGDLTLV
jgi:hypothetical protein